AGFWMFWPTITALIQELTPEGELVEANTFLLAGIQGGWLMAGAIVGFVYNHIGLGGVLLIDVSSPQGPACRAAPRRITRRSRCRGASREALLARTLGRPPILA